MDSGRERPGGPLWVLLLPRDLDPLCECEWWLLAPMAFRSANETVVGKAVSPCWVSDSGVAGLTGS